LAALIVIVILSFAAAGILSYSMTTYRNSMRQAILDQAKEVADSEMEYLFYEWKTELLNKEPVANISCLTSAGLPNTSCPLVNASQPTEGICYYDMTVNETPFSSSESGWQISRTLVYNPIAGTSDGSAQGLEPGTQQIGRNYYFSAEVSATTNNPIVGSISFHSGRHFVFSSTSLFQFAVFYQGNLEIAAGGNMTITGPISTNASAYMGSQSGYTLTLSDYVYYFQDYNGASDPLSGETDRLQGTGALTDPVYNPNPQSSAPGDQTAQRALQVVKLSSQSSFIGGVDVANDIVTYSAAYSNLSGTPDPNEVYRAVIAPPPTDGSGNLLPEDPVVASSRMYNNASLLITVDANSNPPVHIGTAANPTQYDSTFASTLTAGASPIISNIRQQITDPREELNGTPVGGVNMTTLDVGNLNNALTSPTGAIAANPTLAAAYNGVVYVYDKTNNTTAGVPNSLNAVRISDGTTTPNVADQNGNPLGFTVVSNNGVYVQGDFNTTPITVAGQQINNPTAIMGDAVTALSYGWNPADSSMAIGSRQATNSPALPANGPMNPATNGTPAGMTVNAAILTGNTPSTTAYNSGGVQNLVRMIEDWYDPDPTGTHTGMVLTLNGSLGQLFTSKYFTGPYKGNAIQAGLPNSNDRIYLQPKTRNFDYDAGFKSRSPAGSPTTTNFARGDFFFW
jgi:hypothetical protein